MIDAACPRTLVVRRAVTALLLCASACSQKVGQSGPLPSIKTQSTATQSLSVTFSVFVPSAGNGSKARSASISAGGQSSPVEHDLTASAPGCVSVTNGLQCTVAVAATAGNDTFLITTYDAAGGTGNIVSTGMVTQQIASGQTNSSAVTLGGTVAHLALAVQGTPPPEGVASKTGLTVMAIDASGATMVGPDPYAAPITLGDTDPRATTTLSTTTVSKPSVFVTLSYTGKPLSSAGHNARLQASSPAVVAPAIAYFYTAQQQWVTWGGGPNRNMYNANETTITEQNVGGLHQVWSAPATGVFTGAPIVVANVATASGPLDMLFTGDEHATFSALNAGTGAPMWTKTLNTQTIDPNNPSTLGCRDLPGGVYGISESPVFDPASNRVYVVDALGDLYGFDAATGASKVGPTLLYPYLNGVNITTVYGALTLDPVNGVLYIPLGAHCGLPTYGGVTRYSLASGAIAHFYTEGVTSTGVPVYYGGVWGPGGVSLDPRFASNPVASDIYFSTGNGGNVPPRYGESVLRLSESLSVVGHNNPTGTGGGDLDLGGTPLVFTPVSGCGKTLVAAEAKTGGLYIYDADNITGGPLESIQIGTSTSSGVNIGTPAYDPVTNMMYIANGSESSDPSTHIHHGLLAFHFNWTCHFGLAWQFQVGPNKTTDGPPAPPTVANGMVFYADGPGLGCSPIGQPKCVPGMTDLYVFDASHGSMLLHQQIKGPIFTPPVVVNGHVYLESWNGFGPGVIYAYGL